MDVASTPETNEGGAADVVRRFYQGINSRDFGSVEKLIADNCVYEDLIFPQPFTGRKVTLPYPLALWLLWNLARQEALMVRLGSDGKHKN